MKLGTVVLLLFILRRSISHLGGAPLESSVSLHSAPASSAIGCFPFGRYRLVRSGNQPSIVIRSSGCAAVGLICLLTGFRAWSADCVSRPAGLVAWWSADGRANDIVGSHNGTLSGGASFATGEGRQAFSFDGSSGYVQVPDNDLWAFGTTPHLYPARCGDAEPIGSELFSSSHNGHRLILCRELLVGHGKWLQSDDRHRPHAAELYGPVMDHRELQRYRPIGPEQRDQNELLGYASIHSVINNCAC